MALTRERRLPHLHLSLDLGSRAAVHECALRYPNPKIAAQASTSTSTSATRSGKFRLSDFDKLAVLGRGNGGIVYKVCHRRTSALYALKILHYGDSTGTIETDILRQTDSPFIVRCHSVLPAASGDVALLLELIDGGSLDSLVRNRSRRAYPEAALAEVAAQTLGGLAYLHSRRIVHRDIKPANLLVSAGGEVKIADFGVAKVLSRADDQCTSYVGTAAYMSPERFDPEPHGGHYDPYAADVWSLGVTILELFMGCYPLLPVGQKPSWAALMCAICFGEMPRLPEGTASEELRGFVAACLQKDYKKRASVAELLVHPFIARRDRAKSSHALRELIAEAACILEVGASPPCS